MPPNEKVKAGGIEDAEKLERPLVRYAQDWQLVGCRPSREQRALDRSLVGPRRADVAEAEHYIITHLNLEPRVDLARKHPIPRLHLKGRIGLALVRGRWEIGLAAVLVRARVVRVGLSAVVVALGELA